MPSPARIRAARAQVEILLEDKQFFDRLRAMESGVRRFREKLERAGKRGIFGTAFTSALRGMKQLELSAGRIANKMRAIGTSFSIISNQAATAAIGAGFTFVPAVADAVEFDRVMQSIRARTRLTTQEFETLKAQIKTIAASSNFSPEQVGKGFEAAARAGNEDFGSLTALGPTIIDLAVAEGAEDLSEVAKTIESIRKTINATPEYSPVIADTLVAIANASPQGLEDIAESAKLALPDLVNLTKSAEEALVTFAVLSKATADRGLTGSIQGTGLRRQFKNFAQSERFDKASLELFEKQGRDAVAFLEKGGDLNQLIGATLRDSKGDAKELLGFYQEIESSLRSNLAGGLDRVAFTDRVAGRGSGALNAILASSEVLEELQKKFAGVDGAASRTASIINDGLFGAFVRARSSIQEFRLTLGEALDLSSFFNGVERIANRMSEWVSQNRELVAQLPKLLVGFVGFFAVAKTGELVFKTLGGALNIATVAVFGFFNAITGTVAGIVGAVATIGTQGLRVLSLSARGVTSALAGLGAAGGAALNGLGRTFRRTGVVLQRFGQPIAAIQIFLQGLGRTVTGTATAFFTAFNPAALAVAASLTAVTGLFTTFLVRSQALRQTVQALGETFNRLAPQVQRAFGLIFNLIKNGQIELAFQVLAATVKLIWAETMLFLRERFAFAFNTAQTVMTGFTTAFRAVGKVVSAVGKGIVGVLDFIGFKIVEAFGFKTVDEAASGFLSIFSSAKAFKASMMILMIELGNTIINAFEGVFEFFEKGLASTIDAFTFGVFEMRKTLDKDIEDRKGLLADAAQPYRDSFKAETDRIAKENEFKESQASNKRDEAFAELNETFKKAQEVIDKIDLESQRAERDRAVRLETQQGDTRTDFEKALDALNAKRGRQGLGPVQISDAELQRRIQEEKDRKRGPLPDVPNRDDIAAKIEAIEKTQKGTAKERDKSQQELRRIQTTRERQEDALKKAVGAFSGAALQRLAGPRLFNGRTDHERELEDRIRDLNDIMKDQADDISELNSKIAGTI